jgi:hypothetical protein
MSGESNKVQFYLENVLPTKIISANDDMRNFEMIECKSTASNSMDGFLSSIFQLNLHIKDKTTNR